MCLCTHKKTHKSSLETEELRLTGEAECAALRLAMNQSCWVVGRYIMKYECVIKCLYVTSMWDYSDVYIHVMFCE